MLAPCTMAGIHVIASRPKLVKWIELKQLQKVYDSISKKTDLWLNRHSCKKVYDFLVVLPTCLRLIL